MPEPCFSLNPGIQCASQAPASACVSRPLLQLGSQGENPKQTQLDRYNEGMVVERSHLVFDYVLEILSSLFAEALAVDR